jgi:E3 ubiquitin-protein ligase MYCBP2
MIAHPLHKHPLKLVDRRNNWLCDGRDQPGYPSCSSSEDYDGKPRYRCVDGCDYDLCETCIKTTITDPQLLAKAATKTIIKAIFDDQTVAAVRLSQIRLAPDTLEPELAQQSTPLDIPKIKGAVVPRYLVTVWQQQSLKVQLGYAQLMKDAEDSARLRVISAWYGPLIGAQDQRVDVSDTVRGQVVNGKLTIRGAYRPWFGPATCARPVLRLELRVLGVVDVIVQTFEKDQPIELDAIALASERNVDLVLIEKAAGDAGKPKPKPAPKLLFDRKAIGRKPMRKKSAKNVCELCEESHDSPITYHSRKVSVVFCLHLISYCFAVREAHPGCGSHASGQGYNSSGSYIGGWVCSLEIAGTAALSS